MKIGVETLFCVQDLGIQCKVSRSLPAWGAANHHNGSCICSLAGLHFSDFFSQSQLSGGILCNQTTFTPITWFRVTHKATG